MLNPDVTKWIMASFSTHFRDKCARDDFPMYLEGTGRKANTSPNYWEYRTNGPYVNQLTQNEWHIWYIVNILIAHGIDDENMFTMYKNQGDIVAAFTPSIELRKYGTGENDDSSLVDCFKLCTDTGEKIKVTNFGQLVDHLRVMQSTIEATYELYTVNVNK